MPFVYTCHGSVALTKYLLNTTRTFVHTCHGRVALTKYLLNTSSDYLEKYYGKLIMSLGGTCFITDQQVIEKKTTIWKTRIITKTKCASSGNGY